MDSKDKRDIAAYYGAACVYDEFYCGGEKYNRLVRRGKIAPDLSCSGTWLAVENRLDWYVLSLLPQSARYFKLHLRSIASLTDEEVIYCAQLAGWRTDEGETVKRYPDSARMRFYTFEIHPYKNPYFYDIKQLGHISVYGALINIGQIITYLQSISVYVPGTIDEQYVTFI